MKFNILCKDAEALLEDICQAKSPVEMLQKKLEDAKAISETKGLELRGLIKELKKAGYINAYWAQDTVHYCQPQMSIETYRKRLKEYKEFLKKFNASGSVTNNIDNSVNASVDMGNSNKFGSVSVSSGGNNQNTQPKSNRPNGLLKILKDILSFTQQLF